jgi:hypothetical protein
MKQMLSAIISASFTYQNHRSASEKERSQSLTIPTKWVLATGNIIHFRTSKASSHR